MRPVRRLEREYARTDRGKRAVQFGLLTSGLTMLGHVLAGGTPTPVVLILGVAFAAWHRLSLGGRQMAWAQLLGAAALAQVVAHLVLWVGGHDHGTASGLGQALPAGSMLGVHAVLAVVMALVVRATETRLLARLWIDLLLARRLPVLGLPASGTSTVATPCRGQQKTVRVLDHAIGRRGPPTRRALPFFTPNPVLISVY